MKTILELLQHFPEIDRNTLGKRLRLLRVLNKLTLQQVAEATKLNYQSLARLETDQVSPNIKTINPILDYYEVTYEFLVRGSNGIL